MMILSATSLDISEVWVTNMFLLQSSTYGKKKSIMTGRQFLANTLLKTIKSTFCRKKTDAVQLEQTFKLMVNNFMFLTPILFILINNNLKSKTNRQKTWLN